MSIDELLGLSVEELEKLTDEELLKRYEPIFKLEPEVPLSEIADGDNAEDKDSEVEGTTTHKPRTRKPRKDSKAKIAALKSKLMEASKAGLDSKQAFDKLFED